MRPTDEKLLAEIEQTLAAATGEPKNRRIHALEQFVRVPLTNATRAVDVLCAIVKKFGAVQPEATLVTKYLAKAAYAGETALDRLTSLIEDRHVGAIQCGYLALASLRGTAQVRLGHSLAKELLRRDAIDSVTEALVTALKQLKHLGARRVVTKELSKSLDSPDGLQLQFAVTILSEVGDRSVEPALVKVLGRVLDGYYGGHANAIRESLCSYFFRFKSRPAVPGLLRGIERHWDRRFSETIAAICDAYPEVQRDLLRLARKTSDVSVKLECLSALATMRNTKPRVKDIAGIVADGDLLKYDSVRGDFKKILLRNPRESKSVLLELVRANDVRRYEFALEVLKEMRVPIAEVSTAIGVNPVIATYNYFFEGRPGGLALRALWEEKQKLGDGVKGTTTKFEHLLRHLLSCLGFVTLDVDPSRRTGVDTVAFPPTWSYALLVGTTTGVVGDNLEKLANTLRGVRAALGELDRKIEILPIVATSMSGETNPKDEEYARKHGIVVLRQSDIDRLMEWVSTNRSYKKLLVYLEGKAGKGRRRSLWEAVQPHTRRV